MDCKECHKKMTFAGRLNSTRIFVCLKCRRLTTIIDGHKRHDFKHDAEGDKDA